MTDDPRRPSGDIDPLGAAPTVPASAPARRRRSPRRWLRGTGLRPVALVVLAALLLALAPTVLSSVRKTPRNMVGISYGGGPLEAAKFQKVVEPGSGLFLNGLFDRLYLYPSDTQAYIVSRTEGAGTVPEADSIVAPSQDHVQIEYEVAVYFKLNTDLLQDFHEDLGLQYSAYQPRGWRDLIRDTFRQQVEGAIQEDTREHDVADIYGNADSLTAIQSGVEDKLSARLIDTLGQPYFCAPTFRPGRECEPPRFVIKAIGIPEGVATAFERNRIAQVEIEQRTAEAEAIEALNDALAAAGMPYVLLKAIESGKVDFWVLPSDGDVTLQVPDRAGGSDGSTTTTTPEAGG
jgi:hypothetical protein